jgi:Flp pilus assembly protein TadG
VDTLKKSFRSSQKDIGSELVELAIVMPILVLLLLGIVDFAFLFQRWEVVTNATQEGARLASLDQNGVAGMDWTDTEIQDRVKDYLLANGLSVTPTVGVDVATSETIDSVVVNTVTVSVTYPSSFIFLPGSVNLKSSSVMRSEGGS